MTAVWSRTDCDEIDLLKSPLKRVLYFNGPVLDTLQMGTRNSRVTSRKLGTTTSAPIPTPHVTPLVPCPGMTHVARVPRPNLLHGRGIDALLAVNVESLTPALGDACHFNMNHIITLAYLVIPDFLAGL